MGYITLIKNIYMANILIKSLPNSCEKKYCKKKKTKERYYFPYVWMAII